LLPVILGEPVVQVTRVIAHGGNKIGM